MQISTVLRAIDDIYETTANDKLWPSALSRIGECFEASGALLITQRDDGILSTVASPELAEAQREYEAGWWREDFLSRRGIEQGALASGNTVTDYALSTEHERQTHPFYTSFRRRHGLGHVLAGSISPVPTATVFLSVQRPLGAPRYDEASSKLMECLIRHCERALVLSCRIEQHRLISVTLEETLARLGCGVLLLDETGKVTHASPAGERHVGAGHVQLIGGRISLPHPEARRDLDSAILSALRDTPEERLACARPVIARRRDGLRPLVLHVLPLRTEAASRVWSPLQRTAALVVIVDLEHGGPLDPALVRDYLGLTLGEARVAARIGLGETPRATAVDLGITEETVRTTLKRIFSKTGVSRQSELAALLSRLGLVAPVSGTGGD